MGAVPTLAVFVDSLIGEDRRFQSEAALAHAIGVAQPKVNLVRRGKVRSLNLLSLLKLANVTDTDPSDVLRMAGHATLADELADLYEPGPRLPFQTRRLMKRLLALSEPEQQTFEQFFAMLERARRRHS